VNPILLEWLVPQDGALLMEAPVLGDGDPA
jgi:hypothetical protein